GQYSTALTLHTAIFTATIPSSIIVIPAALLLSPVSRQRSLRHLKTDVPFIVRLVLDAAAGSSWVCADRDDRGAGGSW
ncbi:hypothetical protein JMJ77_0010662, partial [Colletotrichum scovillei]